MSDTLTDGFTGKPDGALTVADSGHEWVSTGTPATSAVRPSIISGRLANTEANLGLGYAQAEMAGRVTQIGGHFSFGSYTTTGGGAVLLVSKRRPILDNAASGIPDLCCHLNITAAAWAFAVFQGNTAVALDSGSFSPALTANGTTLHSAELTLNGDTATFTLPDGSTHTVTDERIDKLAGRWATFEIVRFASTDSTVKFSEVHATSDDPVPIGPITWELCERDQTVLAELDERLPGGKIDIGRQVPRAATLTLDLSDEDTALVSVGDKVLRASIEGWSRPAFVGRVSQEQIAYSNQASALAVSGLDPLPHLSKLYVLRSGALGGNFHYAGYADDEGSILWDLIDQESSSEHGIAEGSVSNAGPARLYTFPAGQTLSEAIASVTQLDGGGEVELEPVEASDGTLVECNILYPETGLDRTDEIVLKIGVDADDNATALSYSPSIDGMVNMCLVIGDPIGTYSSGGYDFPVHQAYLAYHSDSVDQYGTFQSSSTESGTYDASILADKATAVVAANAYPLTEFSITLDPDTAPAFGPEGSFWIGDVISVQAELPNGTLALQGRIASCSLVELENGKVEVTLVCEPEAVSGVVGSALTVIMTAGDGTVTPAPSVDPVAINWTAMIEAGGFTDAIALAQQMGGYVGYSSETGQWTFTPAADAEGNG